MRHDASVQIATYRNQCCITIELNTFGPKVPRRRPQGRYLSIQSSSKKQLPETRSVIESLIQPEYTIAKDYMSADVFRVAL